jgi:hypothetical protein
MLKIRLDKIGSYEIEGSVCVGDLTEPMAHALKVKDLPADIPIEVHATFGIEMDYDIPMVQLCDPTLYYNGNWYDLDDTQYNRDELEEKIQNTDDDTWAMDKGSGIADFMDQYGD